jgi:hypothetical protein
MKGFARTGLGARNDRIALRPKGLNENVTAHPSGARPRSRWNFAFRYTNTDFGITVGLTPYRGALKP